MFKSILVIVLCAATLQAAGVDQLRCEYRQEPIGVDVAQPRLSWILESGSQTAYQVVVDGWWDSGKVISEQSVNVEYAGPALAPATRYHWKVRVWDADGRQSRWSPSTTFTTGLREWQAQWIGGSTNVGSLVLRHEFGCKAKVRRAVVYVCGLGQYELTLNGRKVGEDFLAPGWSKYDKTCLYDGHEVTSLLDRGKNTVQLLLGNGMYNVTGGRYAKFTGTFGPLKAIAQIHVEYVDGTTEIVATDKSWQMSPGPITFSCVYGGEDLDGRWQPQWSPVTVVKGPGGQLKGLSCAAPPIRAFEVLKPVSVNGSVYDLGQNAAIMTRLKVEGPAGATVKLAGAELLTADGKLDDIVCRNRSYCTYTLAGKGVETWVPKFYYRGCRYLHVECTGGAEVKSLEGVVVHSAARPVGEFACSSELFNRIYTLVRWAQRSNMMSVMTDCPHREKLGWLEEYHLNGPALRYNFDLGTLFAKGMNDMADSQLDSGLVPDIAPEFTIFKEAMRDAPCWGSAVVLVPWQQYLFHGDTRLFHRNYDVMARYVAYLSSRAQGHIIDYGLGDWCDIGPNRPGRAQLTPLALTATAIQFENVTVMARIAALLGKTGDAAAYQKLAEEIRGAFKTRFPVLPASQAGMAMPLALGLVEPPKRQEVLKALVADVETKGLTAGDVGYRYLLRALADNGRSDVVFQMVNQSEKPGYGYQLKMGATSLAETWDAQRTSSQNHFMLGQINEWFYHDLAGIQCDPEGPGFKKIIIKPAIVGDLTWVRARYECPYGAIISHWQRDQKQLTLEVTIPANTTALVHMPGRDVRAGKGISVRAEEGGSVLAVGPGIYSVTSTID